MRSARAAGLLGFEEGGAFRRGEADGDAAAEDAQEAAAVEGEPVEGGDLVLGKVVGDRRAAAWRLGRPLTLTLSPADGGEGSGFGLRASLLSSHFDAPPRAAACTAARMRRWVPHRQTLRVSVPTMSSAVGLGFDFSSATEATIIPDVQ